MNELFGFAGMILIQACYLPQLYKTIKTKSVKDLSLPFFIILIVGILFYLIYSILINDVVYMTSNTIGLISPITQIYLILKYGDN